MREPPRGRTEPVLPFSRLTKIFACGVTMMAGTLAMQHYGMQSGSEQRALTLAFTTFVLFQFFNVFNARNEVGSAFNQHFFDNATLWVMLGGVVALQVVAVHWPPTQCIFGNAGVSYADWGIATAVAGERNKVGAGGYGPEFW